METKSNEFSVAKKSVVFFHKPGTVAGPTRDYFYWELHEGPINGLFLDFSARKVGLKELWRLKWHKSFDLNADPPVWPAWMENFKDYD